MEESVGQALLKVQDEIGRLRERLAAGGATSEDRAAARESLAKAESDLRLRSMAALAKAEQKYQELPAIGQQYQKQQQQQQLYTTPASAVVIDVSKDARGGLLGLLERGLVPPAATVSLEPAPVQHRHVRVHDPGTRARDRFPADCADPGYTVGQFRLDQQQQQQHKSKKQRKQQQRPPARLPSVQQQQQQQQQQGTLRMRHFEAPLLPAHSFQKRPQAEQQQQQQQDEPVSQRQQQQQQQQQQQMVQSRHFSAPPPPTTPASNALSRAGATRFVVQNGRVRQDAGDFRTFRQRHQDVWPAVGRLLRSLERLLQKFSVPVAFVNGEKLAELAELSEEPDFVVSESDLVDCLANAADVASLMRRPGRRFAGPGGVERATVAIQSCWRGHRDRRSFRRLRQLDRSARVVVACVRRVAAVKRLRRRIQTRRQEELLGFRRRFQLLADNWSRWSERRRVVVHLPSLEYPKDVRETFADFHQAQSAQMARLCDAADPNVEVILLSAVPVDAEVHQYYERLLRLGRDKDGASSRRWKIVVPEAAAFLSNRRLSLATLLSLSPLALRHVRNLVSGRPAFIVPGHPGLDDLTVSQLLDLPLLCPEPKVVRLYSNKSGCRRVLHAAEVPTPPGEFDVCSLAQLHECLAQLILDNLDVARWLLKIDDEVDGRGVGFFDVERLPCYEWALAERSRFGEKWDRKWAQEKVYLTLLEQLPAAVRSGGRPADLHAYPTWRSFLKKFVARGGVVEAAADEDSGTRLTADLCIEPDGVVKVVSSGDQLSCGFRCVGVSMPQCSVPSAELNRLCRRVGDACRQRGIFGYVSVDFVTFNAAAGQVVWATDISLHHSDALAMSRLLTLAGACSFDADVHEFVGDGSGVGRFGVAACRLRHSRLADLRYSTFFQACKAHGVAFDETTRSGSLFCLVDFFRRDFLGLLTVSGSLTEALETFARSLSVVHQEVTDVKNEGETNFKELLSELDAVIAAVRENATIS